MGELTCQMQAYQHMNYLPTLLRYYLIAADVKATAATYVATCDVILLLKKYTSWY
jgi:hypothetical protein